jgi:hypothetical protein
MFGPQPVVDVVSVSAATCQGQFIGARAMSLSGRVSVAIGGFSARSAADVTLPGFFFLAHRQTSPAESWTPLPSVRRHPSFRRASKAAVASTCEKAGTNERIGDGFASCRFESGKTRRLAQRELRSRHFEEHGFSRSTASVIGSGACIVIRRSQTDSCSRRTLLMTATRSAGGQGFVT